VRVLGGRVAISPRNPAFPQGPLKDAVTRGLWYSTKWLIMLRTAQEPHGTAVSWEKYQHRVTICLHIAQQ